MATIACVIMYLVAATHYFLDFMWIVSDYGTLVTLSTALFDCLTRGDIRCAEPSYKFSFNDCVQSILISINVSCVDTIGLRHVLKRPRWS